MPVGDANLTAAMSARPDEIGRQLHRWLEIASRVDQRFHLHAADSEDQILLSLTARPQTSILIKWAPVSACEPTIQTLQEVCSKCAYDAVVLCLIGDETDPETAREVERLLDHAPSFPELLIIEPRWLAAIVIEHLKPLLSQSQPRVVATTVGAPTHFAVDEDDTEASFAIRYVDGQFQSVALSSIEDDPGGYVSKVSRLHRETLFAGTVLLCTTFLPPVTFCHSAVLRFYRERGASAAALRLVEEKLAVEKSLWSQHVESYRRLDIYDRETVGEYLSAPEYYRMPLTKSEVKAQIGNFIDLLERPNYQVYFAPEPVDIAFEIRGSEVRIRTDRRNRGEPRAGRISSLKLNSSSLARSFEREFWRIAQATEPEFSVKENIIKWLRQQLAQRWSE